MEEEEEEDTHTASARGRIASNDASSRGNGLKSFRNVYLGGRVPRISAVLAFDCRLGARLGNVQHDSRGMGNGGRDDGMGCLRTGCLSEPIREGDLPVFVPRKSPDDILDSNSFPFPLNQRLTVHDGKALASFLGGRKGCGSLAADG